MTCHTVLTSCISCRVFLIRGLQKEELVLLTHGDSVDKVADGFKVVAQSGNIIAGEEHKLYTLRLVHISILLSFNLHQSLNCCAV